MQEARTYLRSRYEMIWSAHLWRDALCEVVIPANDVTREIILPALVDRVQSVIYDTAAIPCEQTQVIYRVDASRALGNARDVVNFSILPPSAIAAAPGGAQLKMTADSANAFGKVSVRGLHQETEVSETVTLNGLGYVFTTYPYDVVFQLAKDSAAYGLAVYDELDFKVLDLPAAITSASHQRISLNAEPAQKAIRILAKRAIKPLIEDSDAPELSGIDNALLAAATGDLLEASRQYNKAQVKFQESGEFVKQMARLEREQSAGVARIIPDVMAVDYDPYC
jgi:hypothetical protein